MRRRLINLIVGIVLTIVGFAFLYQSGIEGFNQMTFIHSAYSTTGIVTKVTYTTHLRWSIETIWVRFKTIEGSSIEFISNHDRDWGGRYLYSESDSVPVLYNPLNPSEAHINSFTALWGSPLSHLIIGLLATVIGVYQILYFIKHKPSLAELHPSWYSTTWGDK